MIYWKIHFNSGCSTFKSHFTWRTSWRRHSEYVYCVP